MLTFKIVTSTSSRFDSIVCYAGVGNSFHRSISTMVRNILYIKFNLAIVLFVSRLNQRKSFNIPVTLCVGWQLFEQKRAAFLCTRSGDEVSFLEWGSQASKPYFNFGRTNVVYVVSFTDRGQFEKFLSDTSEMIQLLSI